MVLVLVTYRPASRPGDPSAVRALLEAAAPRFRDVPGLIRKHFIEAADGAVGGLYEWRSRADAEAFHDAAWVARIRQTYGAEPELAWFDVSCRVDNERGETRFPDGESKPAAPSRLP